MFLLLLNFVDKNFKGNFREPVEANQIFQSAGFFVEVGAVDGDFMSQTLYLEKNLNWTGLLIEPDPRAFDKLKQIKRNAWLTSLCISYGFPKAVRAG